MNVHKNARLAPAGRLELVRRLHAGQPVARVSRELGVSRRTVRKWRDRFATEGAAGLEDRSSRPSCCPHETPAELREQVAALRLDHRLSQRACAKLLDLPRSTVGRWLRRVGLGRLRKPEPDEPVRRYERARAGELIHLDVKKLVRFDAVGHRIHGDRTIKSRRAGWQFIHVAIDDYSRAAFVEVLEDEKGPTAVRFLERALDWFKASGVRVERVMTDNGSCYRARVFRQALEDRAVRHVRTRPYTPKTNGKAERFIGTMVREWAYGRPYENDRERTALLPCWLRYYNHLREHGSLSYRPPVSRLPDGGNNLLGTYI